MTIAYAQPYPVRFTLDRGLSDEADQVRRIKNDEGVGKSFYAMERKNLILNGIKDAIDGSRDNLEALEAYQANPGVLSYALMFLNNLSPSIPFPEIALDQDGEIALEWDYGPRKVISIRVAKDGTLHFAWLVGYSSFHGVETLQDQIPDTILIGINRVINATSR